MPFVPRVFLRILSSPLYISLVIRKFLQKVVRRFFLSYLDTTLDFCLNILLTYDGTAFLFSVDMSSKQFHVHVNQSNSEPRRK